MARRQGDWRTPGPRTAPPADAGRDSGPSDGLTFRLDKIQRLRMKPSNRTGSPKFYYDLLFDYPFGGVEVRNTRSIMDLISRRYQGIKPTRTPEEVAAWLQDFHTA